MYNCLLSHKESVWFTGIDQVPDASDSFVGAISTSYTDVPQGTLLSDWNIFIAEPLANNGQFNEIWHFKTLYTATFLLLFFFKQYFIGIVKPKNINPVIIYWPSCRSKYVQLSSFVKNLLFTIVTSILRQREQDIVSNILTFQTWSMKSASGICMLATFLDMRV